MDQNDGYSLEAVVVFHKTVFIGKIRVYALGRGAYAAEGPGPRLRFPGPRPPQMTMQKIWLCVGLQRRESHNELQAQKLGCDLDYDCLGLWDTTQLTFDAGYWENTLRCRVSPLGDFWHRLMFMTMAGC